MKAATQDPPSYRDEREDLAHGLAATKRLRSCRTLPDYVIEAVDAFADLLAHYAPERSLKASLTPDAPPRDEAAELSAALVAVRRAVACPGVSSPLRRALEAVARMLERAVPARSLLKSLQ